MCGKHCFSVINRKDPIAEETWMIKCQKSCLVESLNIQKEIAMYTMMPYVKIMRHVIRVLQYKIDALM